MHLEGPQIVHGVTLVYFRKARVSVSLGNKVRYELCFALDLRSSEDLGRLVKIFFKLIFCTIIAWSIVKRV